MQTRFRALHASQRTNVSAPRNSQQGFEAVMKEHQSITAGPHRWQKGEPSPNPKGRPLGSRQRIAEKLIADIGDVWERRGATILEHLATEQPEVVARIAYGLLPRENMISVEARLPGNLSPEQWAALSRLLACIETAGASDVSPEQISEWLVEDLRARLAKSVVEVEALPAPIVLPCPVPAPE
jgi:hypothetical protein